MPKEHTPTQAEVDEALDTALENGYDMRPWAVSEVVLDLREYSSVLEDSAPGTLRPLVEDWQRRHRPE